MLLDKTSNSIYTFHNISNSREDSKMSISGIGEKYYQNNVTTMKSTKNVNSTEEFALEKNKRNAGIVGSGRNGIIQKGIL